MSLSSPAPFGDHAEQSFEEDAAGKLRLVLFAIRSECGKPIHDCASHAIAALGRTDGLVLGDLLSTMIEETDAEAVQAMAAVAGLQSRHVIDQREGRVYLNPAVSEAVTREIFR